jgi:Asp-tRNA(Asn)/Glu-tRNA(Gln) amidotransferase A subunit family amidase
VCHGPPPVAPNSNAQAQRPSLTGVDQRPEALAAVEVALARIAKLETRLHAFAHMDEGRARREASRAPTGPLYGLTLGVKDLFDTADQPTEYGSPIYRGHRPRADAAAVSILRQAGAVVVGKTVTAELAWVTPGATTNPHRTTHTPGGSSSGSAAAVAAGMVDLALGTQTAGSLIRPASFCGVFGYKPTFGAVPTAGVKQAAASLDTVGLLAADLAILDRARLVLTGGEPARRMSSPKVALVRSEHWERLADDGKAAIEVAADLTGAKERRLPEDLVGLSDQQAILQGYEGARALTWERATHPEGLSAGLRQVLAEGAAVSFEQCQAARHRVARAHLPEVTEALFGDADVVLTPAALGEAPEGLSSTGDPRCCRLWTLLGYPALSVPGLVGATGLPIGVQLVARPGQDASLIGAGYEVASLIAGSARVAPTGGRAE